MRTADHKPLQTRGTCMTSQITIHDYQVPEVTFEEADTIARNVFGNSTISPDFVEKVLLILQDDRAHVASLQDPWVQAPEGATIPEGVPCRVEYPEGATWEYVTARDWVPPLTAATLFVRKSDLLRVVAPKTRRERIVEEMVAQLDSTLNSVPNWWPTAESWADRYEAAVKKVDGE